MKRLLAYFSTREILGASVILLLALVIFFAPALISGDYFAPTDILRIFGPFADGTKAHNSLLSDPVVQFLPWFKLGRELIQSGNLPLWNIYSGGGLPLMANMQSQVLWPFSIFIYLFNFKVGLLLYTAGKLFLTGFFGYLYLREIKLRKAIAIIGAIAFMFAGFNVVWLMWPHTNAVFLLPLGFYLVERYFRTYDAKLFLWFALALAIAFFGGHPETFFHIVIGVSVYIIFNLYIHRRSWLDFFGQGVRWLGSGLLGVGLSAALLVPFIEYLRLSEALASRSDQANPYFLYKISSVFHFIPDFFGNPSLGDRYYLAGANFNYNETTMAYVGMALLFLTLYVVLWHWRNRLVKFFAILSIISVGVIYNLPVIFDAVTQLPVFQASANHRLSLLLGFGVVVMGCIGLQKLIESAPSRKQITVTTGLFMAVATGLIWYAHSRGLELMQPGVIVANVNRWQLLFVGIAALNFLFVWLILFKAPGQQRLTLFFLLVFAETGVHGAVYNTVSTSSNFYPPNPTVDYLAAEFPNGYYKTFTAEGILLPPNLGSWYGFNHVNDNDAVGIKTYGDLKRGIGALVGGWDTYASPANLDRLAFLGAKYLVYPKGVGQQLLAAHPDRLQIGFEDGQTIILTQPALPRAYVVGSKAVIDELLTNPELSRIQPTDSYQLAESGNETIKVDSPADGYLILNENYYPGWVATVNGEKVAVESAAGLRAIPISAGGNNVETSYQPKSFRVGLYVTFASLLIWLSTMIVIKRQQKPIS